MNDEDGTFEEEPNNIGDALQGMFSKMMGAAENRICPYCQVEMKHHTSEQVDQCYEAYNNPKDPRAFYELQMAKGCWSHAMRELAGLLDYADSSISLRDSFDANHSAINSVIRMPNNTTSLDSWLSILDVVATPFQEQKKKTWLLHGPCGTGKSYAARFMMLVWSLDQVSSMEVTAFQLARVLTDYKANVDDVGRTDLLLIDDFDKCRWTYDKVMALWQLLDHRSMYPNKRTIITSNVEPDQFRMIFTDACEANTSIVESMMQRLHPVQTFKFEGISMRGVK